MKKLKIPKSTLKGTPLTHEEMKQIEGGMEYYKYCSCGFYTSGGQLAESVMLGAGDATTGSESCFTLYLSKKEKKGYTSFDWHYSEGV